MPNDTDPTKLADRFWAKVNKSVDMSDYKALSAEAREVLNNVAVRPVQTVLDDCADAIDTLVAERDALQGEVAKRAMKAALYDGLTESMRQTLDLADRLRDENARLRAALDRISWLCCFGSRPAIDLYIGQQIRETACAALAQPDQEPTK
jgi:hypothetical protein